MVWKHSGTLRFRLAALHLVVYGVILTALCAVVLMARERYLREDFDERLADRAASIIEVIHVTSRAGRDDNARDRAIPRVDPFRFPGYYFEIRGVDGESLERSMSLGGGSLPFTNDARNVRPNGPPVLQTFRGEAARAALGDVEETRLLTTFHDAKGIEPFYLQVAVSLAGMNESIAALRQVFWMVVPAGLLLAAVAAWLLAGRSLAPLNEVKATLDRFALSDLSPRIEPPARRDEIAAMVEAVNRTLDRLSTAFQAQEQFIAQASHELRTPLSVLLGEAQVLMQKARSPEEYERFVTSVQDEVRALAQTVDSVLTLARAEAGLPIPEPTDVSINEAVTDAVQRCEPLATQREVRLVPRLAPPRGGLEPETLVNGDGELLRVMFVNLIRNAIRFSPAEAPVEIAVELRDQVVLVAVRDRGSGIPPQYLDRVFDRFFRIPQGESSFQGVGLGLTIVKGIARLHGGDVSAANRPDGGCDFQVRLPLSGNGFGDEMPD